MAIIRLFSFAVSPYVSAKVGAIAPISPQTAKETAKAVVERKRASLAPGLNDFIGVSSIVISSHHLLVRRTECGLTNRATTVPCVLGEN